MNYNNNTINNYNGTSYFFLSAGNALPGGFGTMFLYNFGSSGYPQIQGKGYANGDWVWFSGINTSVATYNAIRFAYTSGNITSGTISLYGIKQ
jgi:hypothetical protein